jgi:hypothetical protein
MDRPSHSVREPRQKVRQPRVRGWVNTNPPGSPQPAAYLWALIGGSVSVFSDTTIVGPGKACTGGKGACSVLYRIQDSADALM